MALGGRYAHRRIGGITGDVLGAVNQFVELATYLALARASRRGRLTTTMDLVFVRHGRTIADAGRCIGSTDVELSAEGMTSIRALATAWHTAGTRSFVGEPTRIFASDLRRATDSARVFGLLWNRDIELDRRRARNGLRRVGWPALGNDRSNRRRAISRVDRSLDRGRAARAASP